MFKKLFTLYNQSLEKITGASCSLYVYAHIIQIQYGITVPNETLVEGTKRAIKDKVLFSWGAYAGDMEKWIKKIIEEEYNIDIKTICISGHSNEFEELLKRGYAFGIGLRYAGRFYRDMNEDLVITKEEVLRDTTNHTVIGHFLTYFYSPKTEKYYIIDSLGKNRKPIEMDIEVFKEGIKNKVFFENVRTLYLTDKLLDKHLKKYQKGERITHVELLPPAEQAAIHKASRLRVFKR